MTTDDAPLPARLATARRRFEEWRSTRTRPCRIPPELWKAAVRCATQFGVYRTVCALGLDYNAVKRRMKADGGRQLGVSRPVRFVELAALGRNAPPECTVELESRQGVKLRLELRGSGVPDLVDLVRRFTAEDA